MPDTIHQKKVLFVDDDDPLRNAMATMAQKAGYGVFHATNGQDGITTALTEHPDIIVLDILMPRMDGREALRELRSRKETMNIPVILLTGVTDLAYVAETTTYDHVDYLIKTDVSLSDIIKKIRERLS